MKVLRKQTFRTLFFPPEKPTEKELTVGRRRFIEEGAVAAVIYSIATGNFLVGYLSYLGASVSFCALVAMIPNFASCSFSLRSYLNGCTTASSPSGSCA